MAKKSRVARVWLRAVNVESVLRLALLAAVASLVFILDAAPLRAQQYSFKVLDDTDPAAVPGFTEANGINNAGVAVGDFFVGTSSYWFEGFKYSQGKYTTIIINPDSCNDYCDTLPNGINDSDEIVGEYDDAQGYQHGFYSNDGQQPTVFNYPGAYYTIATGVNNKGVIVGFYQEYAGSDETDPYYGANVRGFERFPNGQFTNILIPGCAETELFAINDIGTVVGSCPGSATTAKSTDFTYNPDTGTLTPLSPSGVSVFLYGAGINDAGEVVGSYYDSTSTRHCYFYANGNYSPIPDPPQSTDTECFGMRRRGGCGLVLDCKRPRKRSRVHCGRTGVA